MPLANAQLCCNETRSDDRYPSEIVSFTIWQRFFLPNAHITISNFRSFIITSTLGSGLFAGESKDSSPSPDSVMKLMLEGARNSLSMLGWD